MTYAPLGRRLFTVVLIPLSFLLASASAYATRFGNMDVVNPSGDGAFYGWMCSDTNYYAVQNILIYRDGNYVGRTTTGAYRPDVPGAGFCGGNNYAGWKYQIPAEEYSGVNASWTATVEDASTCNADKLTCTEYSHPNFGATSVYATLPLISKIDYVSPVCFWQDASPPGIVAKPGSAFDVLTSNWNFNTKIDGKQPLDTVISYDAGVYTGAYTAPYQEYFQRGDNRVIVSGSAVAEGHSALQRTCYTAGIMTNSHWLDKFEPYGDSIHEKGQVFGEKGGQHGITWSFKDDKYKLKISSILRGQIAKYQPGRILPSSLVRRPFASGATSSLVFEGDVKIPWVYTAAQEADVPASGQVNYYVYFWDAMSGQSFAIVMQLWDSRASLSSPCIISIGNDGVTPFASQSRCVDGSTGAGRYVTFDTSTTGNWTPGITFAAAKKFRAKITTSHMKTIIDSLNVIADDFNKANPYKPAIPKFSSNLHDYVLTNALFGTEIVGRMSLGASVDHFAVYRTAGATAATWVKIATEGMPLNVGASPRTVRFGTGTRWVQNTLTGSYKSCSSALFGYVDPAPGILKQCDVLQ